MDLGSKHCPKSVWTRVLYDKWQKSSSDAALCIHRTHIIVAAIKLQVNSNNHESACMLGAEPTNDWYRETFLDWTLRHNTKREDFLIMDNNALDSFELLVRAIAYEVIDIFVNHQRIIFRLPNVDESETIELETNIGRSLVPSSTNISQLIRFTLLVDRVCSHAKSNYIIDMICDICNESAVLGMSVPVHHVAIVILVEEVE